MGLRNAETIKKVLDIPQNENVVSVIGIGYSEAASTMPKRSIVWHYYRIAPPHPAFSTDSV